MALQIQLLTGKVAVSQNGHLLPIQRNRLPNRKYRQDRPAQGIHTGNQKCLPGIAAQMTEVQKQREVAASQDHHPTEDQDADNQKQSRFRDGSALLPDLSETTRIANINVPKVGGENYLLEIKYLLRASIIASFVSGLVR